MTNDEINTIEYYAKNNRITELLDYLNTKRNELIAKAREENIRVAREFLDQPYRFGSWR